MDVFQHKPGAMDIVRIKVALSGMRAMQSRVVNSRLFLRSNPPTVCVHLGVHRCDRQRHTIGGYIVMRALNSARGEHICIGI